MEQISGYCKILASARVNQLVNKPFLGKPYLYFGQCHILWSYFFQLGGILGIRYKNHMDEFIDAYIGLKGEDGAVMNFLSEIDKEIQKEVIVETLTFEKYIIEEYKIRIGFSGDEKQFLEENIRKKVPPQTAISNSWQHSRDGAAIGIIHSEVFNKMYDRSHKSIPEEQWKFAKSIGLDVPDTQDSISYGETEKIENDLFMEYCHQCRPDLYSILIS